MEIKINLPFFKSVEHPDVLGDDRCVYSYQRVPRAAFPPRQLGYPEASHGVADVVSQARVEGGLDEASLDVFTLLNKHDVIVLIAHT